MALPLRASHLCIRMGDVPASIAVKEGTVRKHDQTTLPPERHRPYIRMEDELASKKKGYEQIMTLTDHATACIRMEDRPASKRRIVRTHDQTHDNVRSNDTHTRAPRPYGLAGFKKKLYERMIKPSNSKPFKLPNLCHSNFPTYAIQTPQLKPFKLPNLTVAAFPTNQRGQRHVSASRRQAGREEWMFINKQQRNQNVQQGVTHRWTGERATQSTTPLQKSPHLDGGWGG